MPEVLDGHDALHAARASGGSGFLIEDEDALRWQRVLLQSEGIWVEPAGAVALAGIDAAVREGALEPDEPVVGLRQTTPSDAFAEASGCARFPASITKVFRTVAKLSGLEELAATPRPDT